MSARPVFVTWTTPAESNLALISPARADDGRRSDAVTDPPASTV